MKFGLLIGIDYRGKDIELRGCVDDVKSVQSYLKGRGYEQFIMLTDDGVKPTGQNIARAFNTLLENINNGSVSEVWIHYSGHGSHIRDCDGDEEDGFDEVLVPLDYEHGVISDDFINKYFISRISNDNVKIYIFSDSCHSGTVMDLEFKNINGEWVRENNKCTRGKIICISGCRDDQESAECFNLNNNGRWGGALTTTLLEVIHDKPSFRELLQIFEARLQWYDQIPLLTASWTFNIDDCFY